MPLVIVLAIIGGFVAFGPIFLPMLLAFVAVAGFTLILGFGLAIWVGWVVILFGIISQPIITGVLFLVYVVGIQIPTLLLDGTAAGAFWLSMAQWCGKVIAYITFLPWHALLGAIDFFRWII